MSNETRISELVEQIKKSSPFDSLEATRKLIEFSRGSGTSRAEQAGRAATAAVGCPTLDEQVRAAVAALKTPSIDDQLARAGASLRDPILEAVRNLETALAAMAATGSNESERANAAG